MSFVSVEPTTGRVLQELPEHSAAEVDARLSRAAGAFLALRRTSFAERARWTITAADLLDAEQPDIARTVTTEMGKPFAQSKAEVSKSALALRFFAEHAQELLAEVPIASSASASSVRYEPLGPVLAIMPWNFPLWQVIRFAAPALMAGNTGLLKHASNVPQCALVLEDVFRRAGFPDGSFTNLFVPTSDVAAIIADDRVAAVTLTGSERAGRAVAAAAGQALKKSVLELGGADPFLVLPSADLDRAVAVATRARVQNNGQSCIAAKRFIAAGSVARSFTEAFAASMGAVKVGDPFDPGTEVGPLVSEAQRDTIASQVDDARAKGARILCGGTVPDGPGWYYPPTVIAGVEPGMRVATEETFGPVATVWEVADVDEAIAVANDTTFGLGASVWTRDEEERRRCVAEIEAGQVFVNAMVASTPEMPFGGIKRSGYGRELSDLGIKEFCNAKAVWVA